MINRFIIFFLLLGHSLFAQKEDYTWLAGFGSQLGYDSVNQQWYGITKFNFNQHPVDRKLDSFSLDIDESNVAISDADGNLVFATNAVKVYNSFNEKIENGDSLGIGHVLKFVYPFGLSVGYPYPEMIVALPSPIAVGSYDLFYSFIDTFNNNNADIGSKKMLRASLNMNENNQHGKILKKDKLVFAHETNGSIAAVKHANGRDWWICAYRSGSNCHDIMLYDGSDSISATISCGGGTIPHGSLGSLRFSGDGKTLIMSSPITGEVSVFDFDRCSGVLHLKELFVIPEIADSNWYPDG